MTSPQKDERSKHVRALTAIESLFRQNYFLSKTKLKRQKRLFQMEKEAVVYSQNADAEDGPHLRLIIESIRRTAEYASDIAEVVLNLPIESILW